MGFTSRLKRTALIGTVAATELVAPEKPNLDVRLTDANKIELLDKALAACSDDYLKGLERLKENTRPGKAANIPPEAIKASEEALSKKHQDCIKGIGDALPETQAEKLRKEKQRQEALPKSNRLFI